MPFSVAWTFNQVICLGLTGLPGFLPIPISMLRYCILVYTCVNPLLVWVKYYLRVVIQMSGLWLKICFMINRRNKMIPHVGFFEVWKPPMIRRNSFTLYVQVAIDIMEIL